MLSLKEDRFPITEVEEINLTEEKVSYISEKYAADIKWPFSSYLEVIAHSFGDVIPSRYEIAHKFELILKN